MTFAFLAVSAIVPSLLIMRYFHARDRYREPQRVLWATFGYGVLSVFGVAAIFIYSPFIKSIESPFVRGPAQAFFSAAIPEELLKLLVLLGYCARHREYDEPIDGLVYGATASLGFATFENVLYVADGGFGLAVMRAFTAVPAHAFSGAILGWYVSEWKFHGKKYAVVVGYLLVVLLHGPHDAPLLTLKAMGESNISEGHPARLYVGILVAAVSLPIVILEIGWARRLLLKARLEQDGPATRARNEVDAARRALTSSVFVDYVLLTVGGVLASIGGLIAFGFVVGPMFDRTLTTKHMIGGCAIGLPPLAIGLILYFRGLRRQTERLNAEGAPTKRFER